MNWVKWWKPWRRCGAYHPPFRNVGGARVEEFYYGKCELDKDHIGKTDHALERGMDIVTWS